MQVLGYLYISWTKHTERVVFFETSLGNLLYIESNSSLFRFLYEHRPVGSSETRILIRGICFADGRHVEIYWEIRWSVVNASAGLLVHFMDETYREGGFFWDITRKFIVYRIKFFFISVSLWTQAGWKLRDTHTDSWHLLRWWPTRGDILRD